MYKAEFQGCLPFILIIALFLFIAFKLWFVIAIFLIIYLLRSFIYTINLNMKLKQKEKETHYTPHKGEVYKVCPYCNINVKRSAEKCPNCGNSLD